jgi:hypothetical protein
MEWEFDAFIHTTRATRGSETVRLRLEGALGSPGPGEQTNPISTTRAAGPRGQLYKRTQFGGSSSKAGAFVNKQSQFRGPASRRPRVGSTNKASSPKPSQRSGADCVKQTQFPAFWRRRPDGPIVRNKANLPRAHLKGGWPAGPQAQTPPGKNVRNEANCPRACRNGRGLARPPVAVPLGQNMRNKANCLQGETKGKYLLENELWRI